MMRQLTMDIYLKHLSSIFSIKAACIVNMQFAYSLEHLSVLGINAQVDLNVMIQRNCRKHLKQYGLLQIKCAAKD